MSISSRWREECLVDQEIEFLNLGTLAPTLKCAFQAVYDAQLQWMHAAPGASLEIRPARTYLNMMEEQDKCRRVVAEWMRVSPTSIAILGNATDGINAALSSISWKTGDRIITTNEEHEALRYPLAQLKHRFGVEVDVVPFPQHNSDHQPFFEQIADKLTTTTKMVAISSISHRTGVRVDVTELVATLQNSPNVWLLVDGSHAAGTTTDFIKDRIDFYVFPGHKWIFGPVETGILYVSDRVLAETFPLLSGSPMISVEGIRYESGDGAWRYEYGTRDWSKMIGLSTSIQFRQQWSEETILAHYATLGNAFSEGFTSVCKSDLIGTGPLYSFSTEKSNIIANTLWESKRIVVKPQDSNIRLSVPPWIEVERSYELGRLIGRTVEELE